MADDDPWDDLHGAATMTATTAARVAEQLLRANQDRARRTADDARQEADQADRRYETHARLADEYYRRAASPEFVRAQSVDVVETTWRGLREWEREDRDRFGPHVRPLAESIVEVHGGSVDDVDETLRAARERAADQDQTTTSEVDVDQDVEYDSEAARTKRDQVVDESDLEPDVKTAIKIADRQNGHDPALAAQAGAAQARGDSEKSQQRSAGRRATKARTRQRVAERGR